MGRPSMIHELWRPPALYVTEKGMCCDDQMTGTARSSTTRRLMYFRAHSLGAVRRATAEGNPPQALFSAWRPARQLRVEFGYSHRFGLVHVNFEASNKTPKLSFD